MDKKIEYYNKLLHRNKPVLIETSSQFSNLSSIENKDKNLSQLIQEEKKTSY